MPRIHAPLPVIPRGLRRAACAALVAGGTLFASPAPAQMLTLSNIPLYVGANVQPLVMLTLSKDQQLYKKAYNDYTDLDGDGVLDTTYKHSIDYYGYFDPYKCYTYSTTDRRFTPASSTADKYCATPNTTRWSGNFLNWATMSRMDAVRKLLYGGMRSTDTAALTVLERAYLPPDAHSFAKYYAGTDVNKLTPHSPPSVAPDISAGNHNFAIGTGLRTLSVGTNVATFQIGDQVDLRRDNSNTNYMRGVVACVNAGGTQTGSMGQTCGTSNTIVVNVPTSGAFGSGTGNVAWTIRNYTRVGLTMCNTTLGGAGALGSGNAAATQNRSQTNTNLPLIRVVQGNYELWSSNERWQCRFREETTSPNQNRGTNFLAVNDGLGERVNGNYMTASGLSAASFEPSSAARGLGGESADYVARVEVCKSGLVGTERCKQYPLPSPGGSIKPIGLLQIYGDGGLLNFGLMTGSYAKNVSGGVLRKNVGPIADEVNVNGDGTFKAAALAAGYPGIVNTLNRMRIYGYNYGDGTYLGANGDNCGFQLTSINQGDCTSWGNPMSEIYYEALRYYAGQSPTPAYTYTSGGSKDATLGLPLPAWQDMLDQNTYCAPLNAIVFNASASHSDNDEIPSGSTKSYLGGLSLASSFSTAVAARNATQWTDLIGASTGENIHGQQWFVGRVPGSTNEFCTAKTVGSLGSISGICPEGPTVGGSYLISGLAYAAHTNRLRDDLTVPASNQTALKVDTYAVQLATNVPQLNLRLPGEATPKVVIQPTYRLFETGTQGGGALVDMKVVSYEVGANFVRGAVYINWEDSEQGGDYDMDMWGIMRFCMQTTITGNPCPGQGANTVSVTTQTIAEATNQPQGFGYTISGTTKDGPHFHSGIEGFDFTDSTGITVAGGSTNTSGGCSNCQVGNSASTATYAIGVGTGKKLEDPLWYAAKWGGFVEEGTSGNQRPDLQAEWDRKNTSGAATPDGVPDNYFLVSNPLGMESSLDKAFVAILTTSSASSVATNSTSLNTGSRIYQARFNSNDWSGQLLSFTIDINGVIAPTPEWDAGQVLGTQAPNSRNIATLDDLADPRVGRPFRWADLNAEQRARLNVTYAGVTDALGSQRVEYLRGDPSKEGFGINDFRRRVNSKLGDIVNSNPQYVGPPSEAHPGLDYQAFRNTHADRPPMIYVGANDGMLHAFNAGDDPAQRGKEMFAYVPSSVYHKLSWLTGKEYAHRFFVDGTPAIRDVFVNGAWRTVLVGVLAGGGQALFALDVTEPLSNTEASANEWVLWEFKDADIGGRLGNVYGFPRIAKMNNGKWAVIVSGGYNNSYNCAALPCVGGDYVDTDSSPEGYGDLFILFIENGITNGGKWIEGVDYVRLSTKAGSVASPNGLAAPTAVDVDGDGMVDYVYAGDLQGNLWKFDVSRPDAGDWDIAFPGGKPLYSAYDPVGNPQPITAPAEYMAHPKGGALILFGTGMYLQPTDPNTPYQVNTFYGIWDKQAKTFLSADVNPSVGPIGGSVVARDSLLLQQQEFIAVVTGGGDIEFRVSTDNPEDFSKHGWYIDFPKSNATGERMVVTPLLRNGKIIITSLVPSTASCDAGGTGWLTDLDALSGSRLTESPFDVNADNVFNTNDFVTVNINGVDVQVAMSSRKSQVGITPTPTVIAGGPGREFKVTSGSTGGRESVLENPGGAVVSGTRRSWREILRKN